MQQLTNALIGLEEERAIWIAKEKDFAKSFLEKGNSANAEVALLSENICKVINLTNGAIKAYVFLWKGLLMHFNLKACLLVLPTSILDLVENLWIGIKKYKVL